jgi:hypothetical protein
MILHLTDEEKIALAAELKRAINEDRYPPSPRVQTLKGLCHGNERRIERGQGLIRSHAAATASDHCAAASALKIRSVDREMRWR